ncbi:MAG: dihydrolipoyl dehydrogenase [Candidatus Aminicenantes bacterium]|jgi:dihydrolipoamide dehydrogenase
MDKKWDIVIIGGGPGGYVAAIRAAQLKKKVLLVEKDRIGGTCMNWGCIPTKYLLHQTQLVKDLRENKNIRGPLGEIQLNWAKVQEGKKNCVDRLVKGIAFLLEKNGVGVVRGTARLKSEREVSVLDGDETTYQTDKIVLAAGSEAAGLPFLQPNGKEIITSRDALELEAVPASMLIIGAGAIGLEMGTIFQRLGCEVTILEILPTVLPGADRDMAARLERLLKIQGIKIFTQMRTETWDARNGKVQLKGICQKTQTAFSHEAERVLLAAGRSPNSSELQHVDDRLSFDRQGFLNVDQRLETGIPGIYAIGDLIGGKLLAHKASHEGIIAVENACGMRSEMNYNALPSAVFTEPEFASVGKTESEAEEQGLNIQVGLFSLQANGRALTMGKPEGMAKIVSDSKDRILGAQILAPHASEIIMEVTLAIQKGLKLHDLSSAVHIHPTLSESVMEASLKARNEAIHMLNT